LRHAEKLIFEEQESIQKEKLKQEIGERIAREKAERAAIEKTAREKEEREKTEKAAQEKLVREVAEKTRKEQAKREAIEKAAREKVRHDATEKAKRDRVERVAAQIAALRETFIKSLNRLGTNLSKVIPFLIIAGITGVFIGLLWVISLAMPNLISPKTTATPNPTLKFVVEQTFEALTSLPSSSIYTTTPKPNATPTISLTPIEVLNRDFDLYTQAPDANWIGTAGSVTFGGSETNGNGFAIYGNQQKLEDGSTWEKVLEIYPQLVNDGVMTGLYGPYTIMKGQHFKAKIGFLLKPHGS